MKYSERDKIIIGEIIWNLVKQDLWDSWVEVYFEIYMNWDWDRKVIISIDGKERKGMSTFSMNINNYLRK